MKTNTIESGENAVQIATRQLFDEIYKAAKNGDGDALKRIRNKYILNDDEGCFSVVYNGYTPLTLLLKEGDLESAAFLYNRHRQPLMEMERFLVSSTGSKEALQIKSLDRYQPKTIQDHIHCIEILIPQLTDVDMLVKKVGLEKRFLMACASIFSGDDDAVSDYLSSHSLAMSSNADVLRGCIGYLFGKYRSCHPIKEIWPGDLNDKDTRQWFLKGFFSGGHFDRNAYFMDEKTKMPQPLVYSAMQDMVENPNNMLHAIYHPTILLSLLASIDRDDFRNAMTKFFSMFNCEFNHEKVYHHEVDQILKRASILNRFMHVYHLTFKQVLLVTQPHIHAWFTLGLQFVRPGRLFDIDCFVKIGSSLTEPPAREKTLRGLFKKFHFMTNYRFLIDDLDHYLSEQYKANHSHAKRVASFKDACLQINSMTGMKKLINHQIGLFKRTVEGDCKSKLKHERPFGKKGRDEFVSVLEKYQARIQ